MFLSLLPALALAFAYPVLSASSSPNDPFRDIALQAPKAPELPICCLRPLEPVEPSAGDDVFISFEDWKARRLGEAGEQPSRSSPSANNAQRLAGVKERNEVAGAGNMGPTSEVAGAAQASGQESTETVQHDERLSPHFRIPTVDRFNYAATDCSARVHTAHRSAKSPSSILSSKKDRYMLSPCAEKKQFVVVELCDDIMIDTVQLANYEFFSGVFKDFSVSVAKTSPTDEGGWTHAGTYRAQNVRGVQSFHPPPTLRDFYRFIRIDFHSHYGNEYYCPLSLFRVYGLTHLEQWKWDEWESRSKARRAIEDASAAVESTPEPPQAVHIPVVEVPKPDPTETVSVDKVDTRSVSGIGHTAGEDRTDSAPSNDQAAATPTQSQSVGEPQSFQDVIPPSDMAAPVSSIIASDSVPPETMTTPDDLHNVSHVPQTAHATHPADGDSTKTTPSSSILHLNPWINYLTARLPRKTCPLRVFTHLSPERRPLHQTSLLCLLFRWPYRSRILHLHRRQSYSLRLALEGNPSIVRS
ncbi:UNC-like C-terminal-domain-containing protein [Fomitopsis serialis]|uniref:UNC-like C-terminal-domain-containing protein n=1 Tax=Fomitopsis serialis TaxID=139415 RepID=UPI002007CF88|nr:UNC-like C-terminal-domain-containing protein [Neoantrodia serialis]KAH9922927.1 UNC-like C-terminal-domain-containing protein [Neoantrodia serialis]